MKNSPCWFAFSKVIRICSLRFVLRKMSKSRPHYAGGIWKLRFSFENASNVFRPHYAGEIYKHNNHRSFLYWCLRKLGQENHRISRGHRFQKLSFPSTRKRKAIACVASVSVGFRGKELKRLSPQFRAGKITFRFRSLVFLCSPTPRKRLLRRLTQSRRFEIPPIWRAFSKSSRTVFVTD